MNNIYRRIYKQIKKYNTIVIARHIGADPDALGSQFALRELIMLKFPKKKVYAISQYVFPLLYGSSSATYLTFCKM